MILLKSRLTNIGTVSPKRVSDYDIGYFLEECCIEAYELLNKKRKNKIDRKDFKFEKVKESDRVITLQREQSKNMKLFIH